MKKPIIHIKIDGESAKTMYAAGIEDLKDYLLPELLGIKKEDIKELAITQLSDEELGLEWCGLKNNYYRDE